MDEVIKTTKERILDAAISLFSEKGFSESSMKDIAQEVDIKAASIYNHFTSKTAILDVIMDEYFAYIKQNTVGVETVDQAIHDMDSKAVLDQMFFVFAGGKGDRYPKILKIILQEQYREERAGAFVRDIMFKDNEAYVKGVLDKLAAAGKIQPVETNVYAKVLISLTISTSVEMMFYEPEAYHRQKRVSRRRATDVILDSILLPEDTPKE